MRKFQLLLAGLGVFGLMMVTRTFEYRSHMVEFINANLTDEQKITLEIEAHKGSHFEEWDGSRKDSYTVYYLENQDVPDERWPVIPR